MANPYLAALRMKKAMVLGSNKGNPPKHIMGGSMPKPMSKVVSSYEGSKITSPKMDDDMMNIKKAGPTKANRVKAKKVRKFKKAGSGGVVGKSFGTYAK